MVRSQKSIGGAVEVALGNAPYGFPHIGKKFFVGCGEVGKWGSGEVGNGVMLRQV